MSFKCNRCESVISKWYLRFGMSLDFQPDQPNEPHQADQRHGHLCSNCRGDFREFLAGGSVSYVENDR